MLLYPSMAALDFRVSLRLIGTMIGVSFSSGIKKY